VYYQPLQTILAIKERNGGKLDSHDWFFNAFAEHLQA
jgi:chitin synthase